MRQIAPRLERSISRAVGLSASTLRFGRADEAAPQLRKINLSEAVALALEDALAPFPELSSRVEVAADLAVLTDADHLHRVLTNLLRNAAQAMEGRNRVGEVEEGLELRAVRDGRLIYVTLADHGPGVPEKVRARLFEPFVGADRGGTGLGLAIARELARAMGGDVTLLRSDASGASFQIVLRAA